MTRLGLPAGPACLLAALLLLLCAAAQAGTELAGREGDWVHLRVRVEHTLGPADSPLDARRYALRKAKLDAVEKVGTYVESQSVLQDSRLTSESVRSYAAAFIQAEVVGEEFGLRDGRPVLVLEIEARVNQATLERKVRALLEAPQRAAKLRALEQQNQRLASAVETLSQGRYSASVHVPRGEEGGREWAESPVAVAQLEQGVQLEFQRGALVAGASADRRALHQRATRLDLRFWQALRDSLEVRLGQVRVQDNADGTVDLIAPIRWRVRQSHHLEQALGDTLDPEPVHRLAYPFSSYNPRDLLLIPRPSNARDAAQLFDSSMGGRSLRIELRLGERVQSFVVAGSGYHDSMMDTFRQRPNRNDEKASLVLLASPKDGEPAPDVTGTGRNPIVFKAVPRTSLNDLSALGLRVVLN